MNLVLMTEDPTKIAGARTNGVKFLWNAAADLPAGFKAQNVKVKVTVEK